MNKGNRENRVVDIIPKDKIQSDPSATSHSEISLKNTSIFNNQELLGYVKSEEPNASVLLSLALNYFKPPRMLSLVKELSSRQLNSRSSSTREGRRKQ